MKSRRWPALLCLIILLALTALGACNQDSKTQEPPVDPVFIWQVTSATTHAYLLGSIHVASQDIYPLAAGIEEAYAESDYLVLEIDSNQTSEAAATQLILQYAVYPQSTNLQAEVSPELYQWLSDEFARFGVDIAQLNYFRPWFVAQTLANFQNLEFGYTAENGIDQYFQNQAVAQDKTILELESIEYQFQVFSSIDDDLWILDLQNFMQEPTTKDYMDSLFEAWAAGDPELLRELIYEPVVSHPQYEPFYEVMFDVRNLHMADKIEEHLAGDEVYFIIAGAGHMVGDQGLVNLLRERGYTVSQSERN